MHLKTYFPRTYIAFQIFFNVARPVTETTHLGIVLAVWEKFVFAVCSTWVSVSCQFRQCSDNVSSCMWSEHGICYVNNVWEIRRERVLVFIKVTSISPSFICEIWNGAKLAHVDIKQVETLIIWKLRSSFAKTFHYFQAVIENVFTRRRWMCSCTGPYHMWRPVTCDEMQVLTRYEGSTKSLNIITILILWNNQGFVFYSFPFRKCWQNVSVTRPWVSLESLHRCKICKDVWYVSFGCYCSVRCVK